MWKRNRSDWIVAAVCVVGMVLFFLLAGCSESSLAESLPDESVTMEHMAVAQELCTRHGGAKGVQYARVYKKDMRTQLSFRCGDGMSLFVDYYATGLPK